MAAFKGRGTSSNPTNRFETLSIERIPELCDLLDDEAIGPGTVVYRDGSRSIVSTNDSPDVYFDASINPYRGCEHGCIYCYARPSHEYLGFSAGLDFESKLMVKEQAPELLRKHLSARSWKPTTLGLSGVTDCYQPIERRLTLTRQCLAVLAEFRNPVCIITKNHLVTRDLDLLVELQRFKAVVVCISLATLDENLARRLEPRASTPKRRLQAMEKLATAGIPVVVLAAPMMSGLNDHELPHLLQAASEAGARYADYTALRLPYGVKDLFLAWLDEHYPERKNKIVSRIRSMREGELNSSRFEDRMRGKGPFADALEQMFRLQCKRLGLIQGKPQLSTAGFRVATPERAPAVPQATSPVTPSVRPQATRSGSKGQHLSMSGPGPSSVGETEQLPLFGPV